MLANMIRRDAAPGVGEALHGLRDVNSLRAFPTGPGIYFQIESHSRRRARRRRIRVQ